MCTSRGVSIWFVTIDNPSADPYCVTPRFSVATRAPNPAPAPKLDRPIDRSLRTTAILGDPIGITHHASNDSLGVIVVVVVTDEPLHHHRRLSCPSRTTGHRNDGHNHTNRRYRPVEGARCANPIIPQLVSSSTTIAIGFVHTTRNVHRAIFKSTPSRTLRHQPCRHFDS